jgi:monofunctional biosynthetic peptidoglycan transglycosylase
MFKFKPPLFWSDYQFGEPAQEKGVRAKRVYRWVWKLFAGLLMGTILIPLLLRWVPPPGSAFMLRAKASQAAIRYHWVPCRRISPYLPIAMVAAEDQQFPRHWGFDFHAISSALQENKRRRQPRGASTITQQVAKNLFLWPGRSYFRKGLEAYFTAIIELLWPKRRILEVYLNIAQFGPNVFGVEAASRFYFKKPASRLDKGEAALLAAVLPNPRRLKVAEPSAYVRQRVWQIKRQMDLLGGIAYLKEIWPDK